MKKERSGHGRNPAPPVVTHSTDPSLLCSEPCVRGHRSSKCQHFDRLMMKVPKAGRPLAKCPHPKGSCSCQKLYAFMVRIPKGGCSIPALHQVRGMIGADSLSQGQPVYVGRCTRCQCPQRRPVSLQRKPLPRHPLRQGRFRNIPGDRAISKLHQRTSPRP